MCEEGRVERMKKKKREKKKKEEKEEKEEDNNNNEGCRNTGIVFFNLLYSPTLLLSPPLHSLWLIKREKLPMAIHQGPSDV